MRVTNITVSFLREKQPAKFEKATPSVEMSAVLDEGEDHIQVARTLMYDAVETVFAGIGHAVPENTALALAGEGASFIGDVDIEVSEDVVVMDGVEEIVTTPVEEKPKKPRGRPKGSVNTRPKKNTKASDEALVEQMTKVTALPDSMEVVRHVESALPSDDVPNIRANSEDRVDPTEEDIDLDIASVIIITPTQLYEFMLDSYQTGKLHQADVKRFQAHFKVIRTQDIPVEKVPEALSMLNQMINEAA